MPGYGMGMVLSQRQVLRQELSVRQRMEMRHELVLAQALIGQLDELVVRDDGARIEGAQCQRYVDLGLANWPSDRLSAFLEEEAQRPPEQHSPQLAQNFARLFFLFPCAPIERVLIQSKLLADGNEIPSEIWTRVSAAVTPRQSDPDFASFESSFWALTDGFEDERGMKAALEWASGILSKCESLGDAVCLYDDVKHEAAGVSDAFCVLRGQLGEDLAQDRFSFETLRVALRLRLQERRYDSGGLQHHLPVFLVQKLLSAAPLVARIVELHHLPVIMAAYVAVLCECDEAQFASVIDRLDQLAGEKDFAKSKDYKCTMLRGLDLFFKIANPPDAFRHFVGLASSIRELIHGFQALEMLDRQTYRGEKIDYPTEVTSIQQLVLMASDGRRATLKHVFGFSDTELDELYDPKRFTLVQRTGLLDMCVTYGSLCRQHGYERGAELSGEVLRQTMLQRFYAWRYSHARANDQLGFLRDVQPWKNSVSISIALGVNDALQQRIGSIQQCGRRLAEYWEAVSGYPITADLDTEFQAVVERLRRQGLSEDERRQCESEARRIRREYGLVATLRQLTALTAETVSILPTLNDSLRLLAQTFFEHDGAIVEIEILRKLAAETDTRGLRRILIEDTDTPSRTMNVGVDPVRSCQRWMEWTSYNRCLPAYVVDANKRVLVLTEPGQAQHTAGIGRSVIRLLPMTYGRNKDVIPLIILERMYQTLWTEEIGAAIWRWAVLKAEGMSDANDTPVMLGTRDDRLVPILLNMLKALKKKSRVRRFNLRLPASMNEFEYSDAMGKELVSGAKISNLSLTTFFVGCEDD